MKPAFTLNRLPWLRLLQVVALVALGLWTYWPCLHGPWLWDDYLVVVENLTLRSADGLYAIWFTTPSIEYWPLTWTALRELWQTFGNQPLAFHVANLVLHLFSALLVWRILARLGLRWGWLGALLFAVHPLNVESVAWITEIKNTLSLPLFLLSLDAFIASDEKQTAGPWRLSLLFYLAAMLAKTSVVMLPVVLLLYVWWKRGRLTPGDLLKTAPYFALALALGLVTLHFQTVTSYEDPTVNSRSFLIRLVGAGIIIFFYLGKFLWPVGLLPIYPRWTVNPPSLAAILSIPFLLAFLYGCWTRRRGWGRPILFGFGFFLINLLPVMGFAKISYFSISWVADHFVYLPMLGLIGLVVAAAEEFHRRLLPSTRPALLFALASVVLLLAVPCRQYAALFGDPEAFWTYTLQGNPHSWEARNNLGIFLMHQNRLPEAQTQFNQALRDNPQNEDAYNNLGNTLRRQGRLTDAVTDFEEAIRLKPRDPKPRSNLAGVLMDLNRYPEAIVQCREAIRLDPTYAEAHNNFAFALTMTNHLPEALAEYRRAVACDPDFVEAHNGLGNVLLQLGRLPEAQTECQKALTLNPNYVLAHATLGLTLAHMGQFSPAIEQFQIALRLDPNNAQLRQGLQWLHGLKNGTSPSP